MEEWLEPRVMCHVEDEIEEHDLLEIVLSEY